MSKISKGLISIGALLIVLSLAFLITSTIITNKSKDECEKIISKLEMILPKENDGFAYVFSSEEMPVLEVENKDICGIVEMPKYNLKLPINNEYSYRIKSMPNRISGSAYDSSLTISGSDKKGQFDCVNQIEIGDEINIIDMTGAQFSYEIYDIYRSKTADKNYFISDDDLTLIIKQEYALECVIVCCKLK